MVRRQKSLKPLHEPSTPVYAAWWDSESDPNHEGTPSWYPGIVASHRLSKSPLDPKYGYVRYYTVHFDDGDEMEGLGDHFVMGREEYELNCLLEDDDGDGDDDDSARGEEGGSDSDSDDDHPIYTSHHKKKKGGKKGNKGKNDNGGKRQCWLGVKNITDRKSHDLWARHVGWYVATITTTTTLNNNNKDQEEVRTEHTFSLLSEALRAYDASVIRRKGINVSESELNLPQDWSHLRNNPTTTITKNNKSDIQRAIKQAQKAASEKHKSELSSLKFQYNTEKNLAVREAIATERQNLRELKSLIKKELRARHAAKLDSLREVHEGGVKKLEGEHLNILRVKDEERLNQLREKDEEMERLGRRLCQQQKQLQQQQQQKAIWYKPNLQVGEEVYAAWWPDMNRKDMASWYSGRIMSYTVVGNNGEEEEKDGEDNNNKDAMDVDVTVRSPFGAARIYTIKYDDDRTVLNNIPEHYVFPKTDYLLSTELPVDHEWKGVKNVTADATCNDEYAKVVGWYVATIDGEEVIFARLAEALHAYDASLVKKKGNETNQSELNLPDEWEWLFSSEGMPPPPTMYTEEELQRAVQEETDKLKHKFDKKLLCEKARFQDEKAKLIKNANAQETLAVKKAVKQAIAKNTAEMKKHTEELIDAAVKDAIEEEQLSVKEEMDKLKHKFEKKLEGEKRKFQNGKALFGMNAKQEALAVKEAVEQAIAKNTAELEHREALAVKEAVDQAIAKNTAEMENSTRAMIKAAKDAVEEEKRKRHNLSSKHSTESKKLREQHAAALEQNNQAMIDAAVENGVENEKRKRKNLSGTHYLATKKLKEQHKLDTQKAVNAAVAKANKRSQASLNIAKLEHKRDLQETVGKAVMEARRELATELLAEFEGETSKALEQHKETLRSEVEKEVEIEHEVLITLHMNKLKAEHNVELEKISVQLQQMEEKVVTMQNQHVQLQQMKEKVVTMPNQHDSEMEIHMVETARMASQLAQQNNSSSSSSNKVVQDLWPNRMTKKRLQMDTDSQCLPPPPQPAKRAKVVYAKTTLTRNVSPPTPTDKENKFPPGSANASYHVPTPPSTPPQTSGVGPSSIKQQHKLTPKGLTREKEGQAAGEMASEESASDYPNSYYSVPNPLSLLDTAASLAKDMVSKDEEHDASPEVERLKAQKLEAQKHAYLAWLGL